MAEGLEEARDAFAQEIPQASRPRDQAGRFVSSAKPQPLFEPRPFEGDLGTDPAEPDGPADIERRTADGRIEEGDGDSARGRVPDDAARAAKSARNQADDEPAEPQPPERIGGEADDAGEDDEKSDKGTGPEGGEEQDAGPRYKIQVDGEEREVSLTEALKGYQREETFNHRMRQMVDVARAIDQRGTEAIQARDQFINLCRQQEQEFAALIPAEPTNWDELYRENPQGARALEQNYKAVYGTLNNIRQRRAAAEREASQDIARRTAQYATAEYNKFVAKNKLGDQANIDKALGHMRRTAMDAGFSEDEITSTYDERMLSILHKAAKYDNMMLQRPVPVQPERNGALAPGSAPRIGNGQARVMGDAQRRLAASGKLEDAANVMYQLLRR